MSVLTNRLYTIRTEHLRCISVKKEDKNHDKNVNNNKNLSSLLTQCWQGECVKIQLVMDLLFKVSAT